LGALAIVFAFITLIQGLFGSFCWFKTCGTGNKQCCLAAIWGSSLFVSMLVIMIVAFAMSGVTYYGEQTVKGACDPSIELDLPKQVKDNLKPVYEMV